MFQECTPPLLCALYEIVSKIQMDGHWKGYCLIATGPTSHPLADFLLWHHYQMAHQIVAQLWHHKRMTSESHTDNQMFWIWRKVHYYQLLFISSLLFRGIISKQEYSKKWDHMTSEWWGFNLIVSITIWRILTKKRPYNDLTLLGFNLTAWAK